MARLVEPRQEHLADYAALLAVNVKAFFKIAAHGYRQVEMPETAIGEIDTNEPAVSAKTLEQARLHGVDLAAQEAGAVHQVAAVCQHEVAAPVCLGISLVPPGLLAGDGDRLQVIGHGVAVGRIVIPCLE